MSLPVVAHAQGGTTNARALSGDRFLAGGGEYKLTDVTAPALYTIDNQRPAYFDKARVALQMLLSAEFAIEKIGAPNRWGVQMSTVKSVSAGKTFQEILTQEGAVRVAPETDDHEFIDRLLALETLARDARAGLWFIDDYGVFEAGSAEGAIGGYHLIEGVAKRAANTRSRLYLNFGEDYRTDFTAGAAGRLHRRWLNNGFDLEALEGAHVRIRGFVEEINGPSIDLTHQKQIELLTGV
ncbi:thermonuclease family protein [Hyphococcus sp.]|uniref:thermonuclease family protein n=1 Tax=Hyphococcus sp. TaxID=2038636 RepID=UPI003CCBD459